MAKYGKKAGEKVEKAMHERKKETSDRHWTITGSEGRR